MEYTGGTSWLHPQHISDINDSRPTPNDDWKDPSVPITAAAGPSGAQQSMDLSEFGLESIPGEPALQPLEKPARNSLLGCVVLLQHPRLPPQSRRRHHHTSIFPPMEIISCRASYHITNPHTTEPGLRPHPASLCPVIRLSMEPPVYRRADRISRQCPVRLRC